MKKGRVGFWVDVIFILFILCACAFFFVTYRHAEMTKSLNATQITSACIIRTGLYNQTCIETACSTGSTTDNKTREQACVLGVRNDCRLRHNVGCVNAADEILLKSARR